VTCDRSKTARAGHADDTTPERPVGPTNRLNAVGGLGPVYVGTVATHFGDTRSFPGLVASFGLAAVTPGWLGRR